MQCASYEKNESKKRIHESGSDEHACLQRKSVIVCILLFGLKMCSLLAVVHMNMYNKWQETKDFSFQIWLDVSGSACHSTGASNNRKWKWYIKMPLKCVRCNRWHSTAVMVPKHLHTWLWYQSDCDDTIKVLYQFRSKYIHTLTKSTFFRLYVLQCRLGFYTEFVFTNKNPALAGLECCSVIRKRTERNEIVGLHLLLLITVWNDSRI